MSGANVRINMNTCIIVMKYGRDKISIQSTISENMIAGG